MGSTEGNTPMGLRMLTVVFGVLGLIAGILTLAFPGTGTLTLILVMAAGLFFLGLSHLAVSIAGPGLPGWLRALGVVVGILALTLWGLVLALPDLGAPLRLAFLAVGLVFHGLGRIAVDGMNQEAAGWTRGLALVAGVLLILLGVLVVVFPAGFGIFTAVVFLSIALVIGGLGAIVAGAVDVPLSSGAPEAE
ncbi:MAG: DUF308 domain-containing protein [Thermoplasmata archaeon]